MPFTAWFWTIVVMLYAKPWQTLTIVGSIADTRFTLGLYFFLLCASNKEIFFTSEVTKEGFWKSFTFFFFNKPVLLGGNSCKPHWFCYFSVFQFSLTLKLQQLHQVCLSLLPAPSYWPTFTHPVTSPDGCWLSTKLCLLRSADKIHFILVPCIKSTG